MAALALNNLIEIVCERQVELIPLTRGAAYPSKGSCNFFHQPSPIFNLIFTRKIHAPAHNMEIAMGRAPHSLRLVNGSADNINTKIVSFDQATERADEARGLRAEARDFEARNGKNPYSDFLLKHGSRPDRSHAATLGHMINIRVRADDGTLQPKLTAAQRASAKIFHSQRKIELARREQISKLICAIRDLAEITEKSENILTQLSPHFDRPIIIKDLNVAVEYLNRFASEWHLHEKGNDGTS